jgi:hypothetical protein
MQDREPTIRSRELGEGLRRAMEHAGLTGKGGRAAARLVTELGVAAAVGQA